MLVSGGEARLELSRCDWVLWRASAPSCSCSAHLYSVSVKNELYAVTLQTFHNVNLPGITPDVQVHM